jgi:hypothetical protein
MACQHSSNFMLELQGDHCETLFHFRASLRFLFKDKTSRRCGRYSSEKRSLKLQNGGLYTYSYVHHTGKVNCDIEGDTSTLLKFEGYSTSAILNDVPLVSAPL